MPKLRDQFVPTKDAKDMLYRTGAVALLKPEWATANKIRNAPHPSTGARVYSVIDLRAYKDRIDQQREDDVLASSDVLLWRTVVDRAVIDKDAHCEQWANAILMEAIAASDSDIIDATGLVFD